MRRVLLVAAIALLASVVVAATGKFQPLNVKTGLWQVTETSTATGLPPITPEMQARLDRMTPEQRAGLEAAMRSRFGGAPKTITYKKCVTKEELNRNAFSGPDEKCNWTVLNSTSREMEVRGTSCEAGKNQGMETDVTMKIHALDSEHVKGSVQGTATGNGHSVNVNNAYTGKWLGSTCPAGTD